jgi:hypothetical protein
MAKEYRIHPSIGIARMGTSEEYYFGPEYPGEVPNEGKPYKDNGDIKRQAQKFRIYEYDVQFGVATAVREITENEATISWSLEIANKKAALRQSFPPAAPRNIGQPIDDLIIKDTASIRAGDNAKVLTGKFKGESVDLCEIDVDSDGRLIIVGPHGKSASVPPNEPVDNFANNDNWYDNAGDGIVSATIDLGSGRIPVDRNARVITASPGFAPAIDNVVTLYDVVFQASTQTGTTGGPPVWQPNFYLDIFPLLKRTVRLQWVESSAASGHGPGTGGNFLDATQIALLKDNNQDPSSAAFKRRMCIFSRLRIPSNVAPPSNLTCTPQNMPALIGLDVTATQYGLMAKWAVGDFTNSGGPPTADELSDFSIAEQPVALDRAALDPCIGGSFNPGIEAWYVLSLPDTFDDPTYVKDSVEAGQLTIGLAVPWQADFNACGTGYWPAQRPNSVLRIENGVEERFHRWLPSSWDFADTVENWSKLGFVVKDGNRYKETEFDT